MHLDVELVGVVGHGGGSDSGGEGWIMRVVWGSIDKRWLRISRCGGGGGRVKVLRGEKGRSGIYIFTRSVCAADAMLLLRGGGAGDIRGVGASYAPEERARML